MDDKKSACPRCLGTGHLESEEQAFWSNEEGHIMAHVLRRCQLCDGIGHINRVTK